MPLWTPHLWVPDPDLYRISLYGITMMARTTFLRGQGAEAAPPTVWEYIGVSNAVVDATGNFSLIETGISGLQEGDLLVACIAYRSNAAITLPSGWTQTSAAQNSGNTTVDTTGSISSARMAYIVRGSSAPALTFTRTSGDVALGRIVAYRGVDQGDPFDVGEGSTPGSAGTTCSGGSPTATVTNGLVVMMASLARTSATASAFTATGFTSSGSNSDQTDDPIDDTFQERVDSTSATGADVSLAIGDAVRTTTGSPGGAGYNCTASSSARNAGMMAIFTKAA